MQHSVPLQMILHGLLTGTLICALPVRAAPAARAQETSANPPCKVLIVAAPRCREETGVFRDPLKFPLVSGAKLKVAFELLGLPVKFYRDEEATAGAVRSWLNKEACDARLPILFFIGHGYQRDGDDVMLTADATPRDKKSGLSRGEIRTIARRNRLPLIVVYDACRSVPQGQRRIPRVVAERAQRGGDDRGVTTRHGIQFPIFLYSTQPGEPAADELDLCSSLVKGLEILPRTGRFRADPWFRFPQNVDRPSSKDLTLKWWFHYGISELLAQQDLQQIPGLLGAVDLLDGIVLASPPGSPMLPKEGPKGVSLLELWWPQHGKHLCKSVFQGAAWMIKRSELTNTDPYKGGYLAPRGGKSGFEIAGRSLFVEVIATAEINNETAPEVVVIGLDAKNVTPPRPDIWLNRHPVISANDSPDVPKTHHAIALDRATWCKVELQPRGTMNYFAVSDVPPKCAVIIRRIILADAGLSLPVDTSATVDLLARWWVDSTGRADADVLQFGLEQVATRRVLYFMKGKGWVGGRVAPLVWVSSNDQVEVKLENLSNQNATVILEVKQGYLPLAGKRLSLAPGESTHVLPIEADGLLDGAAVTEPTAKIRVLSMVVKPRTPFLSEPVGEEVVGPGERVPQH